MRNAPRIAPVFAFAPILPRKLLAASCAVVLGLALPHAGAELEESNCVLDVPGTSKRFARCATLGVPLDPDAPDGETFDLFVARIPAQVANPQPDPLLLIAGGPGQGTVDFYMQMRGAFGPVRRDRDIILVDQRGTGRSAEGFQCDLPADVDFQIADEDALDDLVAGCLASLERDPRFFTTSLAVRDLDAVRRGLGADRWNIYGASYGTRVAQHYLRRYPEHVRSVVLDGVVPPTLVLGPDMALNAQAALDGIFERCARDDGCASRYGDLAATFTELMSRMRESPVSVTTVDASTGERGETLVTEEYLMGVTRLFSYSDTSAALLPLIIDEAARGRFEMLLAQAEMIQDNLERALSFPMHNSVICSEDHPFGLEGPVAQGGPFGQPVPVAEGGPIGEDGAVLEDGSFEEGDSTESAETAPGRADAYLGTSIVDALNTICGRWPKGAMDEDFKAPLARAHPVLLLSGSNDPATPARYAEDAIAEGLSGGLHLVAPGQGHGMAPIGCVPDLMQEFIEAAATEGLDAECLDRVIPAPFFLSAAGPGP